MHGKKKLSDRSGSLSCSNLVRIVVSIPVLVVLEVETEMPVLN